MWNSTERLKPRASAVRSEPRRNLLQKPSAVEGARGDVGGRRHDIPKLSIDLREHGDGNAQTCIYFVFFPTSVDVRIQYNGRTGSNGNGKPKRPSKVFGGDCVLEKQLRDLFEMSCLSP